MNRLQLIKQAAEKVAKESKEIETIIKDVDNTEYVTVSDDNKIEELNF